MSEKIPLLRPHFDSDEIEEIKKVLDSGWVSQGPKVAEFEKMAAEYTGATHAIAVTNCTSALHLALLALDIGPGDEVLVADYTYPATGHSVLYCGATPVFVDIDPNTYNIDPDDIQNKITDKTRAIIPVHTFGQMSKMDEVNEIAGEHNLGVVEDAACAFGSRYRGKYAGTMGNVGCFSFHARKGLTTGEGGMIVTDDDKLSARMRKLSVFGITPAWEREDTDEFMVPVFTDVGYNYKMSDITAAVGVAQLRRLDPIIEHKQELARCWDDLLGPMDLIEPPFLLEDCYHAYQSYVALLDKKINRNKLIYRLQALGVQAQIGTYSSHIQPVYASDDKCPVSLDIFNRAIALPLYYDLTELQIHEASGILKKAVEELS